MINNTTTTNLIVTLADENYIEQAKQIFSGLYWNAAWQGEYMLLAHQIPENKLIWFRDKGILITKCEPIIDFDFGRSSAALSKLLIFTIDFKRWKTITYLDGDVLIKGPLEKLTEVSSFAAVPDLGMPTLSHQFQRLKLRDEKIYNEVNKKYNLKHPAFNAGVFSFNSDIIESKTFNDLVELMKKYHQHGFVDQPILNLYFKNWKKISHVYNIQMDFVTKAYNFKAIKGTVLHFTCKDKPWKENEYFGEWDRSLKLADKIDLSKPLTTGKTWKRKDLLIFNLTYKMKSIIYKIDRRIGKLGLIINKRYPKLYELIKKRN
ncbi:MAG: glycosyltransferase [Candidatus Tenebribacter burtonii]|jgi:lipopolysaccharide biosynthesis glycosyltransferase|nr:glycosyltransferase [Candidatus Tenebribacter burtonii]